MTGIRIASAAAAALLASAPAFAQRWSAPKNEGCSAWGQREWSAHLDDDAGRDWDQACRSTPIVINGRTVRGPVRCDNYGMFGGEFGVWRVPDATCAARWDTPKRDHCVADGTRQWSAILRDIPAGTSADDACARSGATIAGTSFARPNVCQRDLIGQMWGEFHVADASCGARWDTPKQDQCVQPGLRQWSAILRDVPETVDPEAACARTGATIAGQRFANPNVCAWDLLGQLWGEFHVADASCGARWDTPKADYCTGYHRRQMSAILRDIPSKQDLEAACASTAAGATEGRAPDRCSNEGLGGMWGEWDVEDLSCPGDARSDDDRRRDYYLANQARYDAMGDLAWSAGEAYGAQDERPRGWLAGRMREILDSPEVRAEGYDTVSFMAAGSGAFVVGGGHGGGYAMTRDDAGDYRCYEAWSNTFTAGVSIGGSGGVEIGLSSGLIEGFKQEANGVQGGASYGVGYTSGLYWSWNNPGPKPDVVVYGAGTAGFDASIEYAHVWPDAGPEISCDSVL